jgi:Zn-dependent metalloprotease
MCPIIPSVIFRTVADHPSTPDEVKDGIISHFQRFGHGSLSQTATVVNNPSTSNSHFTYRICTMHNRNPGDGLELPGEPVGNDPDEAKDKCLAGLGSTWKFFNDCFGRNSLDGKGHEIIATIHYKQDFGNASWDTRAQQMIFGDGGIYQERDNKRTSHHSPYALDVIAHEWTHGIISKTVPNLETQLQKPSLYILPKDNASLPADVKVFLSHTDAALAKTLSDPAGRSALESIWSMARMLEGQTLNEHISDCFGIMAKHYFHGQTAENGNWDIAPGWWSKETMDTQKWTANYLRTFNAPKTGSNQPDNGEKAWTKDTSFFSHADPYILCGIGNHAFYQAALSFKGKTWEKVGKIWYDALTDTSFQNVENQTYTGWRNLTISHAGKRFGAEGSKKMIEAWKSVGL